ncbi:Alpha-glucosides-binding protein periplasmic protein AglE precursor [Salipiger mucosus DSM 16094]|uniref:Alpha-glucosides-binding protein periplasmic protein AglE n=1 Tax=Salipiger mucosus DSM 16094 TaxID=1123237 RepID=S9Q7X5_9RHOB|nr:Alpha-glucosides-binding protein periplasmic protein AglE precursor [Salipiger mucosus DSM 16094]
MMRQTGRRHILCGAAVIALVAGAAQAQDMPFPVGEGGFHWDSYTAFADSTDFSGETVSITGPWTGNEKEKVDIVFDYFEEATGATVNYSGSDSFEQDIVISTRAGTAPNLAVFPQPGLAADLASQGYLHGAAGRDRGLGLRELRRRRQLGGPRDLRGARGRREPLRPVLPRRPEIAGLVLAHRLRRDGLRDPREHGRAQGADRADRR